MTFYMISFDGDKYSVISINVYELHQSWIVFDMVKLWEKSNKILTTCLLFNGKGCLKEAK